MDNNVISWKSNIPNKNKNHFLLPSPSIRALIIGVSGSGKTSLLLKLLLEKNWIKYKELHVFSKSSHQAEYKILKAGFQKGYDKSDIIEFFNESKNIRKSIDKYIRELPTKGKIIIKAVFYDNFNDIPDPSELNCKHNSLFIFDDVMLEKNQSKVEDFYTRGRHNNCSSIYISQNYYKLPRQTIRTNANILILFSQSKKDLQHIYEDYISKDMTWYEFKKYTDEVFSKDYNYLVINKEHDIFKGRYLKNFNEIYIPTRFIKEFSL